jgi:hypothetical protein
MTKARDLANGGFGLVLVKPSSVVNGTDNGKGTVSFSAASSVSLNGVFSSTYDKYLFQYSFAPSGAINVLFRFRVAGSDNSTSNYYYGGMSSGWSAGATTYYNSGSGQTSWLMMPTAGGAENNGSFIVNDPFSSTKKSHVFGNWTRANNADTALTGLVFDATTSFDAFSFITSSGTITGTVSVYGYNK